MEKEDTSWHLELILSRLPLPFFQNTSAAIFSLYIWLIISVDGDWGNWLPWKSCSVSCGEGERTRERVCNNPAPLHGGTSCPGPSVATDICNEGPCPGQGTKQKFIW